MPVKIQAREIARAAKRNGIKMYGGSYEHCAVSVLGVMVGYNFRDHIKISRNEDHFYREVAYRAGHSLEDIKALEAGYEDSRFGDVSPYYTADLGKNRYFKVGQRLAEMVGN